MTDLEHKADTMAPPYGSRVEREGAGGALRWLRRELLRPCSAHPTVYLPVYRRWGRRPELAVGPDTEIVIEGFPRSANTFAVLAFEQAQERRVRVAHHLHAAAQVKEGVRLGLPCIVLVRHPRDAVASLLVREPQQDMRQALAEYETFYAAVLPVRTACVIGRFEVVTTRYDEVIRELNALRGTAFAPFDHSPANAQRVFSAADEVAAREIDGDPGERGVARPSQARAAPLEALQRRLTEGAAGRRLLAAERTYERFVRNCR
jgi:hypothetical protein